MSYAIVGLGGRYNRIMPKEISGKVIVITGASSGIGRETARLLAREKGRLVLVARREALLREICGEARQSGANATYLVADMACEEDVDRMIAAAHDRFGRIDVLINNAGFGFYGRVESTSRPLVREIFAVNFEAPLYAIQIVVPMMKAQGSGHIINISSVAGRRGLPLSGIYSATKFALEGLSESLRLELRDSGIDVSVINPASTRTEFAESIRRGDATGVFKSIGRVQSAEAVAQSIVRCIRNPKIQVYPYGITRLLVWVNAIAPSLVDRLIMPYMRDRMPAASPARRGPQ